MLEETTVSAMAKFKSRKGALVSEDLELEALITST